MSSWSLFEGCVRVALLPTHNPESNRMGMDRNKTIDGSPFRSFVPRRLDAMWPHGYRSPRTSSTILPNHGQAPCRSIIVWESLAVLLSSAIAIRD
eukprot:scaffold310_cov335-Pavlova_lutheri.AAC.33